MAIEASDDVAWLLELLTGEKPPSTNEDLLFALAAATAAAGDAIDAAKPLLVGGISVYAGAVEGDARDAMLRSLAQYVNDSPGLLSLAAKRVHRMADGYRGLGTQVEYGKLMAYAAVAELLGQLIFVIVMEYAFPGALASFFASARAFLELLMHRLLARVAVAAAASEISGVSLQVVMDALVQRYQLDHGTRDAWDPSLTRQAAEVGALGGAIGLALGGAATALSRRFPSGWVTARGAGTTTFLHPGGERWSPGGMKHSSDPGVRPVGGPAGEGFWTGAAVQTSSEYLTEGAYSYLKEGRWQVGWGAPISGFVSHLAEWGGSRIGTLLRERFPPLSTAARAKAVWVSLTTGASQALAVASGPISPLNSANTGSRFPAASPAQTMFPGGDHMGPPVRGGLSAGPAAAAGDASRIPTSLAAPTRVAAPDEGPAYRHPGAPAALAGEEQHVVAAGQSRVTTAYQIPAGAVGTATGPSGDRIQPAHLPEPRAASPRDVSPATPPASAKGGEWARPAGSWAVSDSGDEPTAPVASPGVPRSVTSAATSAAGQRSPSAIGDVVSELSAAPAVASHIFTVEHDHSGVVFLDGQTGNQPMAPADPGRIRFVAATADGEAPTTGRAHPEYKPVDIDARLKAATTQLARLEQNLRRTEPRARAVPASPNGRGRLAEQTAKYRQRVGQLRKIATGGAMRGLAGSAAGPMSAPPTPPQPVEPPVSAPPAVPVVPTLADVEWAMRMYPLIREFRDLASGTANSPDQRDRLRQLDDAIGEMRRQLARMREEDTGMPLSQRLATMTPQELSYARGYAGVQRAMLTDHNVHRRAWKAAFFTSYPEIAWLQRTSGRSQEDQKLLPLVRDVFDATHRTVTLNDLSRLDTYAQLLSQAGEKVDLDGLRRQHAYSELDRTLAGRDAAPESTPQMRDWIEAAVDALGLLGVARDRRVAELRNLTDSQSAPLQASWNQDSVRALASVVHLAHRHYRHNNHGQSPPGPITVDHLQALVRHRLGAAVPFAWQTLATIAEPVAGTGHWRRMRRTVAKSVRRIGAVRWTRTVVHSTRTYQHVAAWRQRQAQRQVERPDSVLARAVERKFVWDLIKGVATTSGAGRAEVHDPATGTADTLSVTDVAALVWVRRKAYADGRYRKFAGTGDYGPMLLEQLGSSGTPSAHDLARLAVIARRVRERYQHRFMADADTLRALLAEHALGRWNDDKPPAHLAGDDHSRLVTAFHAITALDQAGDLANWLNAAVPGGGGKLTRGDVERALKANFGKALDDGVEFVVTSGGRTFDIRLWPTATGAPKVTAEPTFPGKLENRTYGYAQRAATTADARGVSGDVTATYRFGDEDGAAAEVSASVGGSRTAGHRNVRSIAASVYSFLRAKEDLGWVELPVQWQAHFEERDTGRWRRATLHDSAGAPGTPLADTVRYAVPKFMLPHTRQEVAQLPPAERDLYDTDYGQEPVPVADREHFPLWDLPHGVTRLAVADKVMAELRRILSRDDYAFWKPVVEAHLTNDQLAIRLGDLLRPLDQAEFQQVFRHTLQSQGRHLSFSLTPRDAAKPISKVARISQISRSGETRFDRIVTVLAGTVRGGDVNRAVKFSASVAGKFFKKMLSTMFKVNYTHRRNAQRLHSNRAWLTRAKRLVGPEQVVQVDFGLRLDVQETTADGTLRNHGHGDVDGYAHVLVSYDALHANLRPPAAPVPLGTRRPKDNKPPKSRAQAQLVDDEFEQKKAAEAVPDKDVKWWNIGSEYGLSLDFVERLEGRDRLYNEIVPVLVERGYLPREALGDAVPTPIAADGTGATEAASTPWQHLTSLHMTGSDVNRPGQAYQNWRDLIDQLSLASLQARSDDLPGAGDDQPGITMVFRHPDHPDDAPFTVGLWAEFQESTHRGTTPFQLQFGHTNVDALAEKKQHAHGWDLLLQGAFDKFFRLFGGGQWTRQWSVKAGRAQSNALTSDTDGQRLPSARYDVDMTWRWFGMVGQDRVAPPRGGTMEIGARATILQPRELATTPLAAKPAPLDRSTRSVLRDMTTGIYTVLGVKGLGDLQNGLMATDTALSGADVWHSLSPSYYRSQTMRAMATGAAIPIGTTEVRLDTVPVGRPQILKVWHPYTQQIAEGQVGLESFHDEATLTGWNATVGGGGGGGGDVSGAAAADLGATKVQGDLDAALSLHTEGSYRGIYEDKKMAVIRTAVTNKVTLPDGSIVVRPGELLLNVLLSDVLTHRHGFTDQYGLLTPESLELDVLPEPAAEWRPFSALSSTVHAPASVEDGHFWQPAWPVTFPGAAGDPHAAHLRDTLEQLSLEFGDQELANATGPLASWAGPLLPQMRDGGAAWRVTTGKSAYEVAITAEPLGPPRNGRPSATGTKLYTRANDYQDRTAAGVTSVTSTAALPVSGTNPEHGAAVTPSVAATHRSQDERTRGTNLLSMGGLRANGSYDFDRAVRYRVRIKDLSLNGATRHRTVVQDHVATVPGEGTRPFGKRERTYDFSLAPTVPNGDSRILGVTGLQAVYDAVASSGIVTPLALTDEAPRPDPVVPDRLTNQSLAANLRQMLTPQGASFGSVATATDVVDAGPDRIRVKARFGQVRQIFRMSKAEFESYNHLTDQAIQSQVDITRVSAGVSAGSSGQGNFEIGDGLHSVAVKVSAAHESVKSRIRASQDWIEKRSWLRADSPVYFVYTTVDYTVEAYDWSGHPKTTHVTGTVELVVTDDGAQELGIPDIVRRDLVADGHLDSLAEAGRAEAAPQVNLVRAFGNASRVLAGIHAFDASVYGRPREQDALNAIATYDTELRKRRRDWDAAATAHETGGDSATREAVHRAAMLLDPRDESLRRLRDAAEAAVHGLAGDVSRDPGAASEPAVSTERASYLTASAALQSVRQTDPAPLRAAHNVLVALDTPAGRAALERSEDALAAAEAAAQEANARHGRWLEAIASGHSTVIGHAAALAAAARGASGVLDELDASVREIRKKLGVIGESRIGVAKFATVGAGLIPGAPKSRSVPADTAVERAASSVEVAVNAWEHARKTLHDAITAREPDVVVARKALDDLGNADREVQASVTLLARAAEDVSPWTGEGPSLTLARSAAILQLVKATKLLVAQSSRLSAGLSLAELAIVMKRYAELTAAEPNPMTIEAEQLAAASRAHHDDPLRNAIETWEQAFARLFEELQHLAR
ncbi:hypothetical protein [Catellatospora citrea]|uniref:Uncharacterized protein n=1 Tax=Catellatospora citrea TaxID=53366 RepID=A0A8J3KN51_9ACTN|nr:hypothetical protein [Catellatospora citrea]RKE10640.1 hypothetical protein C8E86_5556 [Catellatospora citrea]GIG03178.1 hypothetical protein Cci01nite_82710 [Catellatospora citrea]